MQSGMHLSQSSKKDYKEAKNSHINFQFNHMKVLKVLEATISDNTRKQKNEKVLNVLMAKHAPTTRRKEHIMCTSNTFNLKCKISILIHPIGIYSSKFA